MTGVRSLTITEENKTKEQNQTYIEAKAVSRYIIQRWYEMRKIGDMLQYNPKGPDTTKELKVFSNEKSLYTFWLTSLGFLLLLLLFTYCSYSCCTTVEFVTPTLTTYTSLL
jgi:hypothetical protein